MNKPELIERIKKLKNETGTVVLAHTYQSPDIIDLADITGDSFALSKCVTELSAQKVIMCGVRFMAETVSILSPEKEVILAAPDATCPMAEQISPKRVREFKKENPDVAVCCYINTTAELKAECDVCVTSSSALKIIGKMPEKRILFIPDKNLGSFVAENIPDKEIILWDGYCPVHNQITADDVMAMKKQYPGIPVAIHPECPKEAVSLADLAGSTADIIRFAKEQSGDVIIVTERRVAEYLNLKIPGRKFYTPCSEKLTCKDMSLTGLDELYNALKGTGGEVIKLPEDIRVKSKKCIDRMLEYGG